MNICEVNCNVRQKLVVTSGIKSLLRYDLDNLDGAMSISFVAFSVMEQLKKVVEFLESKSTAHKKYELMIWDSFRSKNAQEAIYNLYVEELKVDKGLSHEEAYRQASTFVNLPTNVFPHGTGGAVDVTLLINNEEAYMGTDFDEFVPESASDWYIKNPPKTQREILAFENRNLLRSAMDYAGFVGIDSEWWHFEWGTSWWSEVTNNSVVLCKKSKRYLHFCF